MQAVAHARYARRGPRKINQVLTLIRGKAVTEAFSILYYAPKGATPLVQKTLKSAVSNAGKNYPQERLFVRQAYVGQGPTLKRMRPAAMGRGFVYKRKTAHLTIIVSDSLRG